MAQKLPTGTVTFLFTDIEGSTRLLSELGDRYPDLLAEHRSILEAAIREHDGAVFGEAGDAIFAAFTSAKAALRASVALQQTLEEHDWPDGGRIEVRVGVHTGEAELSDGTYVGLALHKAARVASAAHGGQVLVSASTRDIVDADLPEDVRLQGLGPRRLKDFADPEPLFQLRYPGLRTEFPPPRTLGGAPNNLPARHTSFVGRETEQVQLVELVRETGLVTLTGSGGSGKTRLGLEVAEGLSEDLSHGAWLVELAPITDPELVVNAVASALGVREVPEAELLDVVGEYVEARQLLILLDNCEHLLPACVDVVTSLLQTAPGLRILATSREPLGLVNEHVWEVRPLDRPDLTEDVPLEELASMGAVRLFCDRAAQAQHDFALTQDNADAVTRICHHLDGIPLALELAAARLRQLTAHDVADRLGDRFALLQTRDRSAPERQRTLRSMIDWSYELLSADEQRLFHRLSVFAGSFTLDAAAAVLEDGEADVMDVVSGLVDRSLLWVDRRGLHTRYAMLETVREYAWEKAVAAGESEELGSRHLVWYLSRARDAAPELESGDQGRVLDLLEADHDDLRVALERSLEGEPERACELALLLGPFWEARGHVTEARRWLEAVRPLAGDDSRARLLIELGRVARAQGDYEPTAEVLADALEEATDPVDRAMAVCEQGILARERSDREARHLLDESLTLFREANDLRGEAVSLQNLAILDREAGDLDAARERCESAATIWRESGDQRSLAGALGELGAVAYFERDYDRARELWRETLSLRRGLGDLPGMLAPLTNLGTLATTLGENEEAREFYEDALELARAQGNVRNEQACLHNLGVLAEESGDWDVARARFEATLELSRRIDSPEHAVAALRGIGRIEAARGRYGRAREPLTEAWDTSQDLQRPREIVQCVRELAWVTANDGDLEEARRLAEEAGATCNRLDDPYLTGDVQGVQGIIDHAASRLESARNHCERALTHFRELDDPRMIAWSQELLGRVALDEENLDEAQDRYTDSLRLQGEIGAGAEDAIEGLAGVAARIGALDRAARLLGKAEALRERSRIVLPPVWRGVVERATTRAVEGLGRERFESIFAQGREMSDARVFDYAMAEEIDETHAPSSVAEEPKEPSVVLFRCEGDYWTVGPPGSESRIKDVKGMSYLSILFAEPEREFHVLDLVTMLEGGQPSRSSVARSDVELGLDSRHAGELLDPEAKQAYRQRVEELREQIREGEAWGDIERVSRAKEELDQIAQQLAEGVGLGGRDRRAADDTQRARGSVTKAIRGAIKRITDELPDLGSRLDTSVSTGVYCSYTPDPLAPISWEL